MSDQSKEKINSDLKQAKNEGKLRLQKIQQIFKEALSQAAFEFKEGSREIGSIVKDSWSTVTTEPTKEKQEIHSPVVVPIEDSVNEVNPVDSLIIVAPVDHSLPTQIIENPQLIEAEIKEELAKSEVTESTSSNQRKSLLNLLIEALEKQEEFASVKQQYAKLKARLEVLDARLTARYGDRYEQIKQELKNTQPWYYRQKAQMEASGIDPVQHKQAELEVKLSQVGVNLAKKERQIKQHIKELWQITTKA